MVVELLINVDMHSLWPRNVTLRQLTLVSIERCHIVNKKNLM